MLIGFLSLQTSVDAYAGNDVSLDKVDQYVNLSGIDVMINSMPEQIEAVTNQQLLTVEDPEAFKSVMQVLINSWDAVALREIVVKNIQANTSNNEIDALLVWRNNPITLKVAAAEAESTSPTFQADLMRFMADLQTTPPNSETVNAIRRLVVTTEMAETMVEVMVQVTKGMLDAFIDLEPEKKAEAVDAEQQVEAMREMLTPAMQQQAILMSFYIYRNIPNNELDTYSAFYETQLGKKEIALATEALIVAIKHWGRQSATNLVELKKAKDAA